MLGGQRITLDHGGNNLGFVTELTAQDVTSPGFSSLLSWSSTPG